MWQLVFASRHRLIPQQEEQQQHAKRVPDGHCRSFGSWPWQKKVASTQVKVLEDAKLFKLKLKFI